MLRRIRRQLQLIRYHSATRRHTAWTRALECALVLSLLLAIPAMLVFESAVVEQIDVSEIDGHIFGDPTGPCRAEVNEVRGGMRWTPEQPCGEFIIKIVNVERGWPITTSWARRPAALDLNLYDESSKRRDAQLPEYSPLRIAIEEALAEPDYDQYLTSWNDQQTPDVSRHWLGTLGSSVLWWVILTLALAALVELTRFFSLVVAANQADRMANRQAKGLCGACGYNMRGLEFNERCPECGQMVE